MREPDGSLRHGPHPGPPGPAQCRPHGTGFIDDRFEQLVFLQVCLGRDGGRRKFG
jgi:hypothetical protein